MTPTIKILPKSTAEKISAGELIDAPVSIVRELLDNALDANATEIKITVIQGGKRSITIHDNGHGMTEKDLLLSYQKHSTSKISQFEDIHEILSMGFRGEALHAIGAVSQLEILSKTEDTELGHSIKVRDATLTEKKALNRQRGTTVTASHLFYNIPARRKFLSTDTHEWHKIKTLTLQKLMPFPECTLTLTHNNKEHYTQLSSAHKKTYINILFGEHTWENLLESTTSIEDIHIHAYHSKANYFKLHRRAQLFYINKRLISSAALSKVLTQAYQEICPRKEHPLAIICISCPPEHLDINIHPTKQQIKCHKEALIYKSLYKMLQSKIQKKLSIPTIQISKKSTATALPSPAARMQFPQEESKRFGEESRGYAVGKQSTIFTQISDYKIIGVLFETYIILEKKEEVLFIDQHAAHERILYEELRKEIIERGKIPSEPLLTPITIEVPHIIEAISEVKLKTLESLGFSIESFGPSHYIIRSTPKHIKTSAIRKIAEQLIQVLSSKKKAIPAPEEFLKESLQMQACKAAIKSKDSLNSKDMKNLIAKWKKQLNFANCPHGRPNAIVMNKYEFEKFFLRS